EDSDLTDHPGPALGCTRAGVRAGVQEGCRRGRCGDRADQQRLPGLHPAAHASGHRLSGTRLCGTIAQMTPPTSPSPPPLVLTGGRVLTEDGPIEASLVVRAGRIAELTDDPPTGEVLDVGGRLVGPGLVDIHIHGAAGHSFE